MRISWLPRAVFIVRVRGVVRRYNASWLPWAILVVLGWCIFHDHDREYASRYHDHYKISEMEKGLRRHDDKIDELEDGISEMEKGLRRHDDKIDELEDEMDKLEDELGRHDHDREYSKRSHDHSEYSWEWHEH